MSIEQRLSALEDRVGIREFYDRYCNAVHQRNWRVYEDCLTADASFELTAPFNVRAQGARNIVQTVQAAAAHYDFVVIAITGFESKIVGDEASVRASFHEIGNGKNGGLHTLGICDDELVKVSGEWRLKRRKGVVTYFDPTVLVGACYYPY